MYKNVGGEIKGKAVGYVMRNTIIVAVLSFLPVLFVLFLSLEAGEFFPVFLAFAAWGVVIAVAYSIFKDKAIMLYAQGELVENVMIIKSILEHNERNKKPAPTPPANVIVKMDPTPSAPKPPVHSDTWKCVGCGATNTNNVRFCSVCGWKR